MTLTAALLLLACSDKEDISDNGGSTFSSATPVLFSSGTNGGNAVTRASVPYMQKDGKFICRMYYQGSASNEDYNAYSQAWLKVNNDAGNCIYRKESYTEPNEEDKDIYGFDRNSSIFYWQNRKPHVFVAVADYNHLTDETCSLNMDKDTLAFALKRTDDMTSVSDQQDPIQAYASVTPSGATPEANRVSLIFNHCFSKVQVNLKPSVGGGLDGGKLTYDCIDKVELLGVSDTAYVFAPAVPDTAAYDISYKAPAYKQVVTTDYTDAEKEANPYCTSIEMFKAEADNVTVGYITTHDVITFGVIQAIRITWHEKDSPTQKHVVTKAITEQNEKTLKSGYQHIFNLELRRGTLAILNAEILEWETGKTYNNINGTIKTN